MYVNRVDLPMQKEEAPDWEQNRRGDEIRDLYPCMIVTVPKQWYFDKSWVWISRSLVLLREDAM